MNRTTFFSVIPEFNGQSRNGAKCSVSNRDRSKSKLGKADHEVDHFVLRGPMIDHEGFFDLLPTVITETAHDLGMSYPFEVEAQVEQRAQELANEVRAEYEARLSTAESKISLLTEMLLDRGIIEEPFDPADMIYLTDRAES